MSEHTPGPWEIHHEGRSTIYVASQLRDGIVQEIAACGPTEAGREQQEANACLIAAAPDLLAALQGMLKQFTKTPSTLKDSQARADAHRAIGRAIIYDAGNV